jgi:hypothetical protein
VYVCVCDWGMLVRACDEFCAITRGGDKGADFNLASLCLFSFELKRAAASIVGERTRHTIAIVAAAAHFLFMPPRRTELFGSCCCYYWERESRKLPAAARLALLMDANLARPESKLRLYRRAEGVCAR